MNKDKLLNISPDDTELLVILSGYFSGLLANFQFALDLLLDDLSKYKKRKTRKKPKAPIYVKNRYRYLSLK